MTFYQRSLLHGGDAWSLSSNEIYTFRIMPESGKYCDYVQVLIRGLK